MANWRVGAARDLPIADTNRSWDGPAAKDRIFRWAGWPDNPQPSKARKGFLIYDADAPELKGSYKLPFADVVDGELKAIPSGLRAAASRLPQTDAPQEVLQRARAVLDAYFRRMNEKAALRAKIPLPLTFRSGEKAEERTKRALPFDALPAEPELEVLGVPFGGPNDGRDRDGEAFHAGTDVWLNIGDVVPVTYYHGLGPDSPTEWQDPPVVIGAAKLERVDDAGYWFRVRLNDEEELAQRIKAALKADKPVRASSGAPGHLVRVSDDGLINVWPVAELAIFDVNDWRQPANDFAVVRIASAKADAEAADEAAKASATPVVDSETDNEPETDREGMKMAEETRTEQTVQEEQKAPPVDVAELADALKPVIEETVKSLLPETPSGAPAVGMKRAPNVHVAKPWLLDSEVAVADGIKALLDGRTKRVIIPVTKGEFDKYYKALSEGTDTAGGYLVAPEQARQVIELLSANAVVRRAGATVIPMNSDTLNIPKLTGGATAYWVAENAAITASDETFGQVQLTTKKLAALVKISAELVADSDPAVEAIVRADLARVLALAEDSAYLRGDGTSNNPTGVRNQSGVTVTELGSGNGATPTFDDLADAVYRLDAADAPTTNRAWIVHPRTVNTLRQIKDSSNKYLWADPSQPGDPPTVWGYPVFTTTQIPINLTVGTSTNCSEIYLGAWSEAIIGQRKALELRASDVAGNAFEYDQVFIRAIMRVGFAIRHAESFEVITGVLP